MPEEARVYTVKDADVLLSTPSYKRLLTDIEQVSFADKEVYEVCYRQLIYRFASYVQLLPEPENARPRSMLQSSMRRAYLMLYAFSHELCAIYGRPYLRTTEGSRLLYAVFSAALLFEVGKICANRKIILTDEMGKALGDWDYFNKDMPHFGAYYKIRFGQGVPSNLITEVTHIIAKTLMPSVAFSWISEDFTLLKQWFVALTVRDEFFGVYKMAFEVNEDLEKNPLLLEDVENPYEIPAELVEIEAFWRWLKEKVARDKKKINDGKSGLYLVDGELAFDHNILMLEFGKIYTNFTGVIVLAQQFNHLGLVPLSGYDYKFQQYFSMPERTAGKGGIFSSGMSGGNKGHVAKKLMSLDKQTTAFYFASSLNSDKVASSNLHKVPDTQSPIDKLNAAPMQNQHIGRKR